MYGDRLSLDRLARVVGDSDWHGKLPRVHVQTRIQGELICGTVAQAFEASGNRPPMVEVRTQLGNYRRPVSQVRECSTAEVGGCRCAESCEAGPRKRSGGPASQVTPLGNTGVTV